VIVTVLIATPQGKKGETTKLANETIEELHRRGFRTNIFATSKMSFAACGGCQACEPKDQCIVQDDIQTLQDAIMNSTGFILATPVYLLGPPGRLKCLLDRFWPWTLRPRLFDKFAGVMVVSGSFGTLDVANYLTGILESWGLSVVGSAESSLMTKDAVNRRKKMLIDCRLLGRRIVEAIGKKKRVGLSTKGKEYIKAVWGLIQDNKDKFSGAYQYWLDNNITKQFGI
jgi:multimeric flavodoxin WrbA